MNKSQELPPREPISPETAIRDVEDAFVFNNQPTEHQVKLCQHIESWGKALAIEIASLVPEGKEQTVAINNVLSAVMWCRHGIMRQPTIEFVATGPVPEMTLNP